MGGSDGDFDGGCDDGIGPAAWRTLEKAPPKAAEEGLIVRTNVNFRAYRRAPIIFERFKGKVGMHTVILDLSQKYGSGFTRSTVSPDANVTWTLVDLGIDSTPLATVKMHFGEPKGNNFFEISGRDTELKQIIESAYDLTGRTGTIIYYKR